MKARAFFTAVLACVFSAALGVPFNTESDSTTGKSLITKHDGSQATEHQELHSRAVIMAKTCTKAQVRQLSKVLSWCERLAKAAAEATELATNDLPKGRRNKLREYFKSQSPETANTVKNIFLRVAKECGTQKEKKSTVKILCRGSEWRDCAPQRGQSLMSYVSYYDTGFSFINLCPPFWNPEMDDVTQKCHGTDRATLLIHEMTHMYSIGNTTDYFFQDSTISSWDYKFVRSLGPSESLENAGNYQSFANAVYASRFGPCDSRRDTTGPVIHGKILASPRIQPTPGTFRKIAGKISAYHTSLDLSGRFRKESQQ